MTQALVFATELLLVVILVISGTMGQYPEPHRHPSGSSIGPSVGPMHKKTASMGPGSKGSFIRTKDEFWEKQMAAMKAKLETTTITEKPDKHTSNGKRFGHIKMPIWGLVLLICSCLATIAIVIVLVKFCNCQKKKHLANSSSNSHINPVMLPHGVSHFTNLSNSTYETEKPPIDFDTDFSTMRYTASPPPAYDEMGAAGWIAGSEEKTPLPEPAVAVTMGSQRSLTQLSSLRSAPVLPPIQGIPPRPGSAKAPQPLPEVDKY